MADGAQAYAGPMKTMTVSEAQTGFARLLGWVERRRGGNHSPRTAGGESGAGAETRQSGRQCPGGERPGFSDRRSVGSGVMIVLDTHAWIWWASQSPKLSTAA